VCQTKDIEDGIGGTMTDYWIDPNGLLWYSSYIGTHTFEQIKANDEQYNDKVRFLNFEWIPTGKHGKFKPHQLTKYIEIYPAEWKGEYDDWPRIRLHFKYGKLMEYENITGKRQINLN
jgi:hypothetical protein